MTIFGTEQPSNLNLTMALSTVDTGKWISTSGKLSNLVKCPTHTLSNSGLRHGTPSLITGTSMRGKNLNNLLTTKLLHSGKLQQNQAHLMIINTTIIISIIFTSTSLIIYYDSNKSNDKDNRTWKNQRNNNDLSSHSTMNYNVYESRIKSDCTFSLSR